MIGKGTAQIHWSKNGLRGGGGAEMNLDSVPSVVEITIDPVRGAKLWLDVSPVPILIQIYEVTVLGDGETVLQSLIDPSDIRTLMTGSISWWVKGEGARLLAIGERNALHIDIPEACEPVHGIRLKVGLIEAAGASSLAEAMGEMLKEAKREHEGFAQQVDSLLAWQREQIEEMRRRSKPTSWLSRLRRAH